MPAPLAVFGLSVQELLVILAILQFPKAVTYISSYALRGRGDTQFPMFAIVGGVLVFELGLGYTLSDRLLVPFRDCGLLRKDGSVYCLETQPAKMAVTLAMLRAVLGLNPLEEEATLWKLS